MKTYSMSFILFLSYHVCTHLFTKHMRKNYGQSVLYHQCFRKQESQAEESSYPLWSLAWAGWWWLPQRHPPAEVTGSPWSPTCPSPPIGNDQLDLPSSQLQGFACGKERFVHKLISFKHIIAWDKWCVATAEWTEIAHSCNQQSSGISQHTISWSTLHRLDLSFNSPYILRLKYWFH